MLSKLIPRTQSKQFPLLMCSCQKNENYVDFQCDRKKYDIH